MCTLFEFVDFELIQGIVLTIIGVVAILIWQGLQRYNIIAYIKAKEALAKIAWEAAVDAAELYGWDIERVKDEATARLTRLAKEHKLNVTEEQIRDLISSAYERWLEIWEEEWEDIEIE